MSSTHPYKRFLMEEVFPQNMEGLSVLDCGCGRGNLGFFIRTEMEGDPIIVGFDIYAPYIEALEKINVYDRVYLMDIRGVSKIKGKYDIIICTDVLEHLIKEEALITLDEMEKLCRSLIVLSFPIGFQSQGIGYEGNEYQIHRSGFSPDELIKRGYHVKKFHRFTRTMNVIQWIRCKLLGLRFNSGRFIAWRFFG